MLFKSRYEMFIEIDGQVFKIKLRTPKELHEHLEHAKKSLPKDKDTTIRAYENRGKQFYTLIVDEQYKAETVESARPVGFCRW